MIIRTSERPEAWPVFSDRVVAAMEGPDLTKGWDTKDSPAELVIAIGNGTARLAERRFPVTVPLLILDDASPWALPPPGVRIASPPPLWSAGDPSPSHRLRDLSSGACYALGCVRRAPSRGERTPAAAQLITVERTWQSGEWREHTSRSPRFDLHYPGDRDHGWNRDDVAIVIGDPGRDQFVEGLREWWSSAGRTERPNIVVIERHAIGDPRLVVGDPELVSADINVRLPLTQATRRVWLFARELAVRPQVDAVAHALGTVDVVGFFDRNDLVPRELHLSRSSMRWLAVAAEPSIVAGSPAPVPSRSLAVTSAGLEALSGAVGGDPAIHLRDVQKHLSARLWDDAPEILDTLADPRISGPVARNDIAPAPKQSRVDTSALRRVFGGASPHGPLSRERPEITPDARIVLLTGRHAVSRSAWLDRWLQCWTEPPVNEPRPVFGWTPRLRPPDEMLVHCREVLLDWSSPPRPLDSSGELAWRIEGSNAVFVLDGLGMEANESERGLLEACARNRAGLLVVSTPQIAGWMRTLSNFAIIELGVLDPDLDLVRMIRLTPPDPPYIAAWLADHGYDRAVVVAIELARAAVAAIPDEIAQRSVTALDAWLIDGELDASVSLTQPYNPGACARIARSALEAAYALSSGDSDRMVAAVRDALELAIATLGVEQCAQALGAPLPPMDETTATEPASISIVDANGRYGFVGCHVDTGGKARQIRGVIEPHELADPRASELRRLAAVLAASLSEPVALRLPLGPSAAALAWELALARAMTVPDGEAEMLRRMRLFRILGGLIQPMRTAEQLATEWPMASNVMSLVGSEPHADGVRAAFRNLGGASARAAVQQLVVHVQSLPAALNDHRGWSLHILGGPLDEDAVCLQADFALEQTADHAAAGIRVDLRWIVQQVQPSVLILQDVPTALATALQARQRAERLRVLAAGLAESVPLIAVIPAVEHDHAPRILHLLFGALAEGEIAAALIAWVPRARKLLLERAAGNLAAMVAVAGDLVIWGSVDTARRPYA